MKPSPEQEREMLKLAVRAVGGNLKQGDDLPFEQSMYYIDKDGCKHGFNPIHSSGDGAELESVLELTVHWYGACVSSGTRISTPNSPACFAYYEDYAGDKQAARRLATLRAAAEIGRTI